MSEFGTPIDKMAAEISVYANADENGSFFASVALFDGDGACISGASKSGFANREEAFAEANERVNRLVDELIESVRTIWDEGE